MTNSEVLVVELYDLFRQRCAEVSRYTEFVEMIANNRSVTLAGEVDGVMQSIEGGELSRELTKTLRANTYLLLYNLVEATMTNAIDAIHKAVDSDNLGFDQLSVSLQNVALSHFKRAIKDNHGVAIDGRIHPIEVAMARLGYDREKIFSGNVDCGEIKSTAKRYGFQTADPNLSGRPILRQLKDLRDKRNALAHGRLSFEQCGQDTSPEYLSKVKYQTTVYLRSVLWSVSFYLRQRKYAAV
ncbi:MAE_28990/MAE_18760 family HEPN-like nuclease [Pseudomonas sp.]|uniref:MAE_28990/MAE_18760 family HEPN-like nuclease n=1 Tax=Pseudomonas sp. TaxID=306 RepID=UPI002BDBFCB2|nr:MAE_28990/MAE_18760 family HEPN-like nuclease [Pseudomonas sp.]HUE94066.1 MAE_28990/MAE_18760 family HEPN-like nuclease [Pseudomonas sp.]